jgi:hypothetical protein
MRKFITIVLLVAGLFYGPGLAEEYKIIEVGPGGGQKWSPNGKYLSYYLEDYLWLYDVVADTSWQAAKYHGYTYEWLNDSQVVFADDSVMRGGDPHYKARLTYTTIGNSAKGIESDSTRELTFHEVWGPRLVSDNAGTVVLLMGDTTYPVSINEEHQKSKPSKAFRAISHYPVLWHRGKNYYTDTDIWLIGIHGEKLRQVTKNKEYALPVLSPNGLLICATDQGGYTVIIDTAGMQVARIYNAQWRCWGPESDILYFTETVEGGEDGGDIVGGDLYCYYMVSKELKQLTVTPNIVESHPQVSPDGTMLAYKTQHRDPDVIEILIVGGGGK